MDLISVAQVTAKLDELLDHAMKDILVPSLRASCSTRSPFSGSSRCASSMPQAGQREAELALLEQTWRDGRHAQDVALDERALQNVNERLWDIEDRIRTRRPNSASMGFHRAGARGVRVQ